MKHTKSTRFLGRRSVDTGSVVLCKRDRLRRSYIDIPIDITSQSGLMCRACTSELSS